MSGPRIGELFAGYGGLGMAVQAVLGGEIAWFSEFDKGPSKILAHRFPGVPNHGDITAIDWATVEPVDILTGGSPCQDLSHAGKRAGMTEGTRSNLWVAMREAIAQLRPGLVVWENVKGAYSAEADSGLVDDPRLLANTRRRDGEPVLRALGRVLGDLSDLGYDARWHGLRAADVGAPHGRFRVFVVAERRDSSATPIADHRGSRTRCARTNGGPEFVHGVRGGHLLPTPISRDGKTGYREGRRPAGRMGTPPLNDVVQALAGWGEYAPAIARWATLTRMPPDPTAPSGRGGAQRLNPAFSEWMMGLPAGWVTNVPGITRNEALKALGNGVVPQQGAEALRQMLAWSEAVA